MGLFNRSQPDFTAGVQAAQDTDNAVLLDVRTAEEYATGHVPGSVNLPLDRIPTIAIDKSCPLFVYCLSGARSGRACTFLKKQGYTVTNMGGISGYRGPLE
ncbi:MAG: rhodanese-like domain-containing protein [Oscillospiraceae bacterium]